MDAKVVQDMKKWDWNKIITIGNGLDDLNDAQWRFMKGLVAELAVEANAGKQGPKYVGEAHKDYDWPKHKVSIELKSQLSAAMYKKKGGLKKNYTIKLNNSNGTNKHTKVPADQVADYLIVVANDGAFVLDKATVIELAKPGGDGFSVVVSSDRITELTGQLKVQAQSLNLKQKISDAIRDALADI